MDVSPNMLEVALGPSVTVRTGAEPDADVVFLPSDVRGTPGQLNTAVLAKLDLKPDIPSAELERGYGFQRSSRGLICYVVTVGTGPTDEALETNLFRALASPEVMGALSIWLPLMGTGAGGLRHDVSFNITIGALRASGWLRPNAHAIISLPETLPASAVDMLNTEIALAQRLFAEVAPADSLEASDVYALAKADAVKDALALAAELAKLHKNPGRRLSSTLLFFALAESQSRAAPKALSQDSSADFFASAVHELASGRYAQAWEAYFETDLHPNEPPQTATLPRPTKNITEILRSAAGLARVAGVPAITIHHLVTALLQKREMRLLGVLDQMGIIPNRLLQEYTDARFGIITTKFRNDVACDDDRLGYDSYARAITGFLLHADTPPPLSISIQAPWGAGKSSLMKLIREQLDPKEDREKRKPKIGFPSTESPLKLDAVLRFLDRQEQDTIDPDVTPKRLWTVWFNAWKYETSEQTWAGLVDAIVSQIAERLPLAEREKFFLKLQLSRIDDGIVRKKIYDRVITSWWSKIRVWILSGITLALSLFGLGAMEHKLPPEIAQAVGLWSHDLYLGGLGAPILLSIYFVASYFKSRRDVGKEPATFSLSEFIRVPNYDKAVGEIHQIHADLHRVLSIVPRKAGEDERSPIVIFIDDLDRCSPGKVASVVEGVCMLLASDTYRCIFVIGMDPQMVAAALEKAHDDVRKQLPRYERTVPLGWRFMDKFVQLPFTIPPTTTDRFGDYVNWLTDIAPTPKMSEKPVIAIRARGDGDDKSNAKPSSGAGLIDKTAPNLPENSSAPSPTFAESRDVGAIIRKVANHSSGNPREMKRMVNLARFYLALRATRRTRGDGWRAPDLDQYARWITITLRWPDMMRWLQWGADEVTWTGDSNNDDLVVRRLRKLETTATISTSSEDWKKTLAKELLVPTESEADWACDPKLFEFFQAEGRQSTERRLSAAAARGFW